MGNNIVNQDGTPVYPDEVRQTREITRGDDFDIGKSVVKTGPLPKGVDESALMGLLSNPHALFGNLTQDQANNIRALIVGAGTGGIYKMLSRHVGSNAAGLIGGLLSAWAAEKMVKMSRE